ncbi:flagella cluster protein [Natrialbaceae archaeon GCM10025810]|uniref:DUF7385 family protein n=1 Tax=Halovalidus salilacus TaxID=3075124 RepID=UPI003610E037
MTRIDVRDGFTVHDYRTKLKLLNDTGDTRTLENREELGCPACGRAFDRLYVSERPTETFSSPPERPFCLARTDDRLLVLTH